MQKYNYDCLMLSLDNTALKKPDFILKEDLVRFEEDTHCTLLYGLIPGGYDENELVSVFSNKCPEIITTSDVSLFENDEFDVLKIGVVPDEALLYLRSLAVKFPNENSYPDYTPHITVAYLKPGTASKYINKKIPLKIEITVNSFVLSKTSGAKVFFF